MYPHYYDMSPRCITVENAALTLSLVGHPCPGAMCSPLSPLGGPVYSLLEKLNTMQVIRMEKATNSAIGTPTI